MNDRTPEIPRCGLCRWYEPAGTRGGFCRLLNSWQRGIELPEKRPNCVKSLQNEPSL